jgi:predicted phosphate transport protein (TIGR00153 family)
MRLPFLSLFVTSPFEGIQEHAEKVRECAWSFQQAMECHVSQRCEGFGDFRKQVNGLEHEADAIKRRIRGHIPKGTLLPVDKFQLFRYLREQDSVLDSVQDVLDWLSFRIDPGIPESLHKDVLLLVDAVIDPIDELARMVETARKYFRTYAESERVAVKEIIRGIRSMEHNADEIEEAIKSKAFQLKDDPITIFHTIRLAELIGTIADHAENAGDMMRAMVAR